MTKNLPRNDAILWHSLHNGTALLYFSAALGLESTELGVSLPRQAQYLAVMLGKLECSAE